MSKSVTAHKNQWVSFYRNEHVSDSYAGSYSRPVIYWDKTYANVIPLNSNRRMEADTDKLVNGFEFRIRQRVDKTVLVDDIVSYRGLGFVVQSVMPDLIYKEDLVIRAISNGLVFEATT